MYILVALIFEADTLIKIDQCVRIALLHFSRFITPKEIFSLFFHYFDSVCHSIPSQPIYHQSLKCQEDEVVSISLRHVILYIQFGAIYVMRRLKMPEAVLKHNGRTRELNKTKHWL